MSHEEIGERMAVLETKMHTVEESQRILFRKVDSFGKWLIATACSAVGGLLLMMATIIGHKLGLI